MDNSHRIEQIESLLTKHLAPTVLNVIDESHLHAGHVGARDGKGHFRVQIASDRFSGLRLIQQHRLIYESLGELMQTDIHALAIEIQ